jgi:integrase
MASLGGRINGVGISFEASRKVDKKCAEKLWNGCTFTIKSTEANGRVWSIIVKAYAERAGFDASTFSGHSLRAGFLTSAAGKGASIFKMMDVSRHKSVDTLRGYVRDAELFKDHARASLL